MAWIRAKAAKRGTGPYRHDHLGLGCKTVDQLFFGFAGFWYGTSRYLPDRR